MSLKSKLAIGLLTVSGMFVQPLQAAEFWLVRFPFTGFWGSEMNLLQMMKEGPTLTVVNTSFSVSKVTGPDGKDGVQTLTVCQAEDLAKIATTCGGSVDLSILDPFIKLAGGEDVATILKSKANYLLKTQAELFQYNLVAGYVTAPVFEGGRLNFMLNVPFTQIDRTIGISAETPSELKNILFGSQIFQSIVASKDAGADKEVKGWGDAELMVSWAKKGRTFSQLHSLAIGLPTGKYSPPSSVPPGQSIGFGKYYTFRPALGFVVHPTRSLSIGSKLTYVYNTKNTAFGNYQTGQFLALDAAISYLTPVGLFGPQILVMRQITPDKVGTSNSPLVYGKASFTSAGFTFSTLLPIVDLGVSLGVMKALSSKNFFQGNSVQLFLSKAF